MKFELPMEEDSERQDKYQKALIQMLAQRRANKVQEVPVPEELPVEPDMRAEAIRNLASVNPRLGEVEEPDMIGNENFENPEENSNKLQKLIEMMRNK